MITEHDRVVLTAPVPKERLEIGDVGTVVHVYQDGKAFEVEFAALDGHDSARPHIGASIRPRCRPERFADGEVFVPHATDRFLSHRIALRQRAASSREWVISRLLIGRT